MKKSENCSIIGKNNIIYNDVVEKHGISSSSVLWDDQQTQYLRFFELVKSIDLTSADKSILDVGCGNGELYKFLNFLGFRGEYTGIDVNAKLINQARERFSGIEFMEKDIFSGSSVKKYDYVLMSGLFNTNVGQSISWVRQFIKKMYDLCKEVLVFNAISTHVTYKDPKMFYLSPAEMLEFCIDELSPRITLSHHNMPYNYTVAVYKNTDWLSANKRK